MKTLFTLTSLFFCFNTCLAQTPENNLFIANFASSEQDINSRQQLTINGELIVLDTIQIDTTGLAALLDIPVFADDITGNLFQPYLSFVSGVITAQTGVTYYPGDTIPFSLDINYDTLNLPFGAIYRTFTLKIGAYNAFLPVYLYFTPYSTVEVWNITDFDELPRKWGYSQDETGLRTRMAKEDIPQTDLTIEEFRDPEIPKSWYSPEGLAYRIAKHAVIDTFDSPSSSADTTGFQRDGCGDDFQRWKGYISGTVRSFITKDDNTNVNIPISGIKVIVWDRDPSPNPDDELASGYTDANGRFNIYINNCQRYQKALLNAWNEGNDLELYFELVAKTSGNTIKVIRRIGTVRDADIGINNVRGWSSGHQSDNNQVMDVYANWEAGTEVKPQLLHWANQSRTFVNNTHSGTGFSLPGNPLEICIYPFKQDQGAFFLPGGYRNAVKDAVLVSSVLTGSLIAMGFAAVTAITLKLEFTNEDGIYMGTQSERSENMMFHEFGHYAMWHLQGKTWSDVLEAGLYNHGNLYNCANTKLAWNEGWADGFSMVMDAVTRSSDNEMNNFGSGFNYEDRKYFGRFPESINTWTIKDESGTHQVLTRVMYRNLISGLLFTTFGTGLPILPVMALVGKPMLMYAVSVE